MEKHCGKHEREAVFMEEKKAAVTQGRAKVHKRDAVTVLLWIGAALVNLKAIFADFGPDQTYAIATSYRHLSGDGLFAQMWEPHQSSAFLADLGMLLYRQFVPDLSGVSLFLQVYGVVLGGLVTYVLFRVLKRFLPGELVHVICLFVFVSRPKLMVFPEFSNMHIGFSLLLFASLLLFFESGEKLRYLIAAAVFLCLQILSYPSCLITFLGVAVILFVFSKQENRKRVLLLFTGICALIGAGYAGFFAVKIGLHRFVENLLSIFTSDVSHTGTAFAPWVFFRGALIGALWLAVVFALAVPTGRLLRKSRLLTALVLLMLSDIVLLFLAPALGVDWTLEFCIVNPALILGSAFFVKELKHSEQRIWWIGVTLSVCSCIAVLLLTNQGFLSVFAYLIPGTLVSFLPLYRHFGSLREAAGPGRIPLVPALFCLWLMAHRMLTVYGYINVNGEYLLTDVENIVRVGPNLGIVTSLDKCNQSRYGMEDFRNNVKEGEKVFLVEDSWYDPIAYLFAHNQVSAYSTIDTPVYDESILDYWTLYPEKEPDVIAVKAWAGVEDIDPTCWFDGYLREHYELCGQGTYWHFYRKKQDGPISASL